MHAKYVKLDGESCPHGCNVKGNWHIRINRSGGKKDFIICSNCGNKIKEVA